MPSVWSIVQPHHHCRVAAVRARSLSYLPCCWLRHSALPPPRTRAKSSPRQCGGDRVLGDASGHFVAPERRSGRSHRDRSVRPVGAHHRSADDGRAAAGAARAGAEAVHGDGRPGRPGVCGGARRRRGAQHLRGGDVRLRPADRRPRTGRRPRPRQAGCAQCELHARPVRAGQSRRRARLDLADRRRDRRGAPVRQRDARRRAQSGRGARRARVRQGLTHAVRRRPRHRHDPRLRSQRPGTRPLRSRHAGPCCGRHAAGAI